MSGLRLSLDMRIDIKLLVCCVCVLTIAVSCTTLNKNGGVYSVAIKHPSVNGGKPIPCSLVQVMGTGGCPQEYYMDVDSVYCADKVCEIITVRIYWDALGGYLRYELPEGGRLTKKAHTPFTPADYEKLQVILSDTGSPLKTFDPASVSAPGAVIGDVDAVTKPTPLFYQTSVVRGAIYTCYTLWHWANGGAVKEIRRLTSESCGYDQLMQYLNDGTAKYSTFAMEQFAERRVYDAKTVNTVVRRAIDGRAAVAQGAIQYLESSLKNGNSDIYYDAIGRLFAGGSREKRTLCLRSLAEVKQSGSSAFYDRLASLLPELESYFEVHLLLNLLEARNPGSAETLTQAGRVLQNDNFLIARRAYWFLEKQTLSEDLAKAVESFRVKYKDRL